MKTKLFTLLLAVAASVGITSAAITVRLDSRSCTEWSQVYIWAWTNSNIFDTWPGEAVSKDAEGWYTYTFASNISSVNILWSDGSNQTTDITGITASTCYALNGTVGHVGVVELVKLGDLYYYLNATDRTAEVRSGGNDLSSIIIPANITYDAITYSVTCIGSNAFRNCSSLTSVTIPNSVTSIANSAFYGCSGLTSINVVTDNPNYCSVEGVLFNKDKTVLVQCPEGKEGDYTIPNSVTSIGEFAFRGCTSLTSVTIGNSVTSIGSSAFYGCSSLTSVTIPNTVTSIGDFAFSGWSGMTSITIPNSVTSIGNNAFQGCSGLTSITIPNSVTSIGSSAFDGCTGLTSVTIPNSVTSIGKYAFEGCSGLTSVTINSGSIVSKSNLRGIFGSQVKEYIIGDDVTSIGNDAFYGCSGLTSVTIGNSVTSIGAYAFHDCSSLTSVAIKAMTPPALYQSYYGIFYGASNCPIYVPCGTLEVYKTAWADYASQIKYSPLEYQITGNVNIEGAGSVQLPQNKCEDVISATPNYGYHFVRWRDGNTDNPRTFVLAQDTTFTAEFAYDRVGTCGKDLALTWSYDPTNKVLTIGNAGEFTENMQFGVEAPNEMEELVIGNSVTAIGANAFAGIETLKKVSIGESVKTIGEQAFYNCVNLETIFNYRPTPTNAYSNAFDGVDKFECKLYVLLSSIDMYKAAAVWRDFYYTYAIGAEEATVTTNDVQVEPQDNAATFTWPTSNNVTSYTIQITKDGVVFCTLTFNANGQLTGIAFAPSRDGQAHAPSALMTANGLQFTVTGLDSGTQYGYSVTAKDANDQTVATYSGEFTTTGEGTATGVDNVPSDQVQSTKFLRDGKMYIIRGEKVYNAQGALVM